MNPLQERFESGAKDMVVMGAAQPALGSKLHVFNAARRTGHPRQFVRQLPNMLADQHLKYGGHV